MRVPATNLDEFARPADLGIDSLTAVEIQIWVKGDLQVEVDVEQLFTTPNIRDLALTINQLFEGNPGCSRAGRIAFASSQGRWVICLTRAQRQRFSSIVFHMLEEEHPHLMHGVKRLLIKLKFALFKCQGVKRG